MDRERRLAELLRYRCWPRPRPGPGHWVTSHVAFSSLLSISCRPENCLKSKTCKLQILQRWFSLSSHLQHSWPKPFYKLTDSLKHLFLENAMLCGKYNCGQMTQVWLWSLSPSAARSRALSVTQLLSSCHPVTQRDFGRNLTNNWQQFVTCFCNFVAGNLSWKLDNNNLDNDGATFPISCKMITSASD